MLLWRDAEIDGLRAELRSDPGSRHFAALADAWRRKGRLTKAVQILEHGIALRPDYVSARVLLAQCLLEIGSDSAAADTFAGVEGLDPENLVALNYRARRAADLGDIVLAARLLDRILEIDPWDRAARELQAELAPEAKPALKAKLAPHPAAAMPATRMATEIASSGEEIPATTPASQSHGMTRKGKPRLRRKASQIALLPVAALLLLGSRYVGNPFGSTREEIPLATVKKGEWLLTQRVSGRIAARQALKLSAPEGRDHQITWLAPEGSYVQPGDLVVHFAASRPRADRQDPRPELRMAKTKVLHAQEKATLSPQDLNPATLAAPVAGMVVYLDIGKDGASSQPQPGGTVGPNQPLIELSDLSEMIVKAMVPEVDAGPIEAGQEAVVSVDAFPAKSYRSQVTWKGTLARRKGPGSNLNVLDVEIAILDHDAALRPGMSASARILIDRVDPVVVAPLEAIFEKDGVPTVYLADQSPRVVRVGRRTDREIEILSGLTGGERICLLDPTVDRRGAPSVLEPELNRGRRTPAPAIVSLRAD